MKATQRRISIVCLILAFLYVLPLTLSFSKVSAEGLAAWDMTSYEDLEDVSEDIIAKYVEVNPNDGVSMDMSFDLDVTFDDSAERNNPENLAVKGNFSFLQNADKTLRINITVAGASDGDEGEYRADFYVQNDAEDPEDLVLTIYSNTDGNSGDAYSGDVMQESVSREDLDVLPYEDLTVDEFNNAAKMKVLEDKGDTLEVVTLISIERFIDSFGREIAGSDEAEYELFDVDSVVNEVRNVGKQVGVSEWVLPVHMTIQKETGHMIGARIENNGLQELVDSLLVLFSETEGADSMESPLTINTASFIIENVKFGVNEPIDLPEDVIQAVEAAERIE